MFDPAVFDASGCLLLVLYTANKSHPETRPTETPCSETPPSGTGPL